MPLWIIFNKALRRCMSQQNKATTLRIGNIDRKRFRRKIGEKEKEQEEEKE